MSRKEFFEPGEITLQYIHDDCNAVGMVVSDEWAEKKLNKEQLEFFKMHFDKGSDHEAYLCLILGWFPRYSNYGRVFGETPKIFPSYIPASKKTATPTILEAEIDFYCRQCAVSVSRGLNFGKIGKQIFSFNPQQTEVIKIVGTIQQYLSGCPLDKLPNWISLRGSEKVIYQELDEIISVSAEQKEIWKKENK